MSVTGYGGLSQIDSVAYEGHGSIYGGDQGQSCVAGGDCSYTGFSQADGQSYLGNIGSRGAVIGANGQSYARKIRTNSHLTLMTRLSNISRKVFFFHSSFFFLFPSKELDFENEKGFV